VITERARAMTAFYVVTDLAMTAMALWLAHGARQVAGSLADEIIGPVYEFSQYVPLLAFVLPLWAVVFYATGLYGRRSARTLRTEVSRLVRAIAVAGLVLAFAIFALRLTYISRPVVVLFLLLDGPLVAAGRAAVRALVLGSSTRRHILVAGARDEVLRTAANIDRHRDWGLRIAGLVTDGTWSEAGDRPYSVLGSYEDIPSLVSHQVIDEVLIAPAGGRLDQLKALEPLFLRLEEQGIVMRLLVNFLPRSLSDVSLDQLDGVPLLTFSTAPRDELLLFVRRCADIVLAGALLLLLSPVLLVIALAIKATSPGRVLFRQTRCGLNGRPFAFLKFRSMFDDADRLKPTLAPFNEMDGPVFKMTNDPRVTPFGRFLRRASLDELPQLWNILRGDMSFVGPRPAVPEEVAQYEPWQRRRLSMKPGLTCLWQVSGRNQLSFEEWMHLDLEYIDNWSLWLDLKIALKTIPAVILGRGAR
jgi:exopolysaccharide biosynthesis polyprenyl glycosylphosphotransferase